MIPNSVIENCIEDLYNITKTDIAAYDGRGKLIVCAGDVKTESSHLQAFLDSPADSQVIGESHLMKVTEDEENAYIIVTGGQGDNAYNVGRIAVSQIKALQIAYQEKYDKNSF